MEHKKEEFEIRTTSTIKEVCLGHIRGSRGFCGFNNRECSVDYENNPKCPEYRPVHRIVYEVVR